MKRIIVFLCLVLTITPVWAKRLYKEAEYQKAWCDKRGGVMEYELPDKCRVDCLLPDMAVEFDFANKWAECIGQSLYYGNLIMERGEKDVKYLRRLRRAAYRKGVGLRTFTMKPEHVCDPAKRSDCPHVINRK